MGVRPYVRINTFLLVVGLIWLRGRYQLETCWSAPHRQAMSRLSNPSSRSCGTRQRPSEQVHREDDLGYLKSDVHPRPARRRKNVSAAAYAPAVAAVVRLQPGLTELCNGACWCLSKPSTLIS
jgi:hypothetical protein